MSLNVLTLIAAPGATAPAAAAVESVVEALKRLGAAVSARRWLAPDVACDIPFEDLDPDQADAAARVALQALGGSFDLVAQPESGRRKRLLLADMESTIIENEMLDELADLVGLKPRIAEITRRAMNDEIDFATALRERVALLKGLPQSALAEAGARIRIMPGARELVATMRADGAYAVLVSGGFRVYTGRIRREVGFDLDIANEMVIENGRIAGTLREPILGRDAKLEGLKRLAAERSLPLAATLAVGDGANDIDMVAAAGLGIAFHAKPALRQRARSRIDHADLTALLYVQGYRADEIRTG
ncbi:MAG TPA: phosphoserine phosphatase SerB [Stellaceae bacterium]|nr:phosphoserine phosphatase SerB [Stellaceae bacterium]